MKILSAILAVLAVAAVLTQVPGPQIERRADWTHTGLDAAGQPEELKAFDLAVSLVGEDMNAGGVALDTIRVSVADAHRGGQDYRADTTPLVVSLPDGLYRIWVRAVDVADLESGWGTLRDSTGAIAPYRRDSTPPSTPGNVTHTETRVSAASSTTRTTETTTTGQ